MSKKPSAPLEKALLKKKKLKINKLKRSTKLELMLALP